jgi:betaine reductase
MPIVNITAVPEVSNMVGIARVLRGKSITNPLGDATLSEEEEKKLRRRYVIRAIELLKAEIKEKQVFTLDETQ